LNGEVHDWYRLTLGFPDHLVAMLIDQMDLKATAAVLDPFCGSGTTLVECMKRNLSCLGIEANPACGFASRVKTKWDVSADRLIECLEDLPAFYAKALRRTVAYKKDFTYRYLEESGMIARGWISPEPLRKAIAIKNAISQLPAHTSYRSLLMLALLSEVVYDASNVKFGPTLYCGTAKADADVLGGFEKRVYSMADDLDTVSGLGRGTTEVLDGDSRDCQSVIASRIGRLDAVICSPPYPTEHDYTRHTRLELAFLGDVSGSAIRRIKQKMIRSHTKGIYIADDDGSTVSKHPMIVPLVEELNSKTKAKTHGFARLYSRVTLEYFGGMRRHLESVYHLMKPGAQAAYVVGDQASYLQVHIPTADILASLAGELGFDILGVSKWRGRWSTTSLRVVDENILMLRKPNGGRRVTA
jgi:hypothetical protein